MHTLRLTAVDRTEHYVNAADYDHGIITGHYLAACGEQLRPAAMVTGPDRTCSACREAACPLDWRQPSKPGVIEQWLRKVAAV